MNSDVWYREFCDVISVNEVQRTNTGKKERKEEITNK
jgi:hypothetical protein